MLVATPHVFSLGNERVGLSISLSLSCREVGCDTYVVEGGDLEALGGKGFGEVALGVRVKTLLMRDLEGCFVEVCLDLDGAAIGVVVAEGGWKGEEPSFGVLGERVEEVKMKKRVRRETKRVK